jgi:hypothetical protein
MAATHPTVHFLSLRQRRIGTVKEPLRKKKRNTGDTGKAKREKLNSDSNFARSLELGQKVNGIAL